MKKKVCKACHNHTFHNLHLIVTGLTGKNEWVSNTELEAHNQDYLVCPLVCPSLGVWNADYALLDSGASIHCTALKHLLLNFYLTEMVKIYLADDSVIKSRWMGDMMISLTGAGQTKASLHLRNVYYHPNISITLISPGLLCKDGYCFLYNSKGVNIYKHQMFISFVPICKSLYWIQLNDKLLSEQNDSDFGDPNVCAIEKKVKITLFELHKMYGHLGYTYLIKLLKSKVDHGYTITNWDKSECTLCSRANIKQVPLPHIRSSELVKNFGNHLHVNIWGHAATVRLCSQVVTVKGSISP